MLCRTGGFGVQTSRHRSRKKAIAGLNDYLVDHGFSFAPIPISPTGTTGSGTFEAKVADHQWVAGPLLDPRSDQGGAVRAPDPVERIGLPAGTSLSGYKPPDPDVVVGPMNEGSTTVPRGSHLPVAAGDHRQNGTRTDPDTFLRAATRSGDHKNALRVDPSGPTLSVDAAEYFAAELQPHAWSWQNNSRTRRYRCAGCSSCSSHQSIVPERTPVLMTAIVGQADWSYRW